MNKKYIYLTVISTFVTFCVVALGAYTRLSNAGLGCPDWPGCYGFLTVPNSADELLAASAAFPGSEVEPAKAWIEMIHRYFASSLGLLVVALLFIGVRKKIQEVPKQLTIALFVMILLQGKLGMLTVTMNLQPFIVMGHLLGGFTILALLSMHCFYLFTPQQQYIPKPQGIPSGLSEISLIVLTLQIALGGWVAANYAAPHCVGLPVCENIHLFSVESLFHLPIGELNYEYGVLPFETRLSIHMLHRVWAVVTVFTLGYWAWLLFKNSQHELLKKVAALLMLGLLCQLLLGALIVHLQFPIIVTLFHNLMAASLLIISLFIWFLLTYRCAEEA
ncbi:MAG: cytochrome B [Pseudoalteromonas sp.]|nr:cytochrome B [Pseudoalteromonas sp.]|tara:strand:+ start:5469 stop:6467 length:999 start_codon:yes stop_codon:yes gene_type:complete